MDELGRDAFDFWIGEWDCTFDGGRAVNSISRELGGNVLVERFRVLEPEPWDGMSVSAHDARTGSWRQTWVDQTPNYWSFVGTRIDGDPSFATPARVDADERYKRMVFSDISDDGLQWRWEASTDGVEWQLLWALTYSRRGSG